MATFSMKSWVDVFDVAKLQPEIEEDDGKEDWGGGIMLIDVGGGRGHELEKLARKKEELGLKGKLILQDRKEVIEQVPEEWKGLFERAGPGFELRTASFLPKSGKSLIEAVWVGET